MSTIRNATRDSPWTCINLCSRKVNMGSHLDLKEYLETVFSSHLIAYPAILKMQENQIKSKLDYWRSQWIRVWRLAGYRKRSWDTKRWKLWSLRSNNDNLRNSQMALEETHSFVLGKIHEVVDNEALLNKRLPKLGDLKIMYISSPGSKIFP